MSYNKIIEEAEKYYTDIFLDKVDGPQAVDWNSVEAQQIRFKQLTKLFDAKEEMSFTVCDFGCGLGDYQDYLMMRFDKIVYTGYDISSEIIEQAKKKHKTGRFICDKSIEQHYDYIVTSGVFNVRQKTPEDEWLKYILYTLDMFAEYADEGFAFNCLTKYSDVDKMKDYLYYADPLYLFDYCKKKFSRNVAILHDYDIYDFTILVRRDDGFGNKN